jgi:hypothetical protein
MQYPCAPRVDQSIVNPPSVCGTERPVRDVGIRDTRAETTLPTARGGAKEQDKSAIAAVKLSAMRNGANLPSPYLEPS